MLNNKKRWQEKDLIESQCEWNAFVLAQAISRPILCINFAVFDRGAIDRQNSPITGNNSISKAAGLTSRMIHDENLADGTCLESTTGVTIDKPGGDTIRVRLATMLAKLSARLDPSNSPQTQIRG